MFDWVHALCNDLHFLDFLKEPEAFRRGKVKSVEYAQPTPDDLKGPLARQEPTLTEHVARPTAWTNTRWVVWAP